MYAVQIFRECNHINQLPLHKSIHIVVYVKSAPPDLCNAQHVLLVHGDFDASVLISGGPCPPPEPEYLENSEYI